MPITTTDSIGQAVTTSRPVGVSVSGDKDETGTPNGGYNVLLSPAFLDEVKKIAGESCSLPVKRSGLSCGINFAPRVMTSFEVFAAAKLAVVAVGDVTIAGFVANLLKDLTEKGQSYPLDITVPQNDLSEASVTAIADPAAPITMTIALVPAKPIATTASSTATTKSLCWKYVPSKPTMNPEEEDYEESEDTDENLVGKRNDAAPNVFGRKVRPAPSVVKAARLSKRDKKGHLNFLGLCSKHPFPTDNDRPRPPNYKKAPDIAKDKDMEDYRWYVPQANAECGIALLTRVGNRSPDDTSPGGKLYPPGYNAQGKSGTTKFVNVDHVYELKLLKLFFESVLNSADHPRCGPVTELFGKTNPKDKRVESNTRLQSLWYQLPNNENKAFIGIDTYINTEKGKIFTPGYYKPESIKTGPGTAAGNINQMNDIGMAAGILRLTGPARQFRIINTNIYRGLLHFDEIQKCEDPSVSDNWAETYKKWIEDFLKARQTELMFMVTNLNLAVLKSGDLMKDGEETAESIGHKQLMDIYGAKLWEWDVNTLLDYSPEALANLPPGAFPIERRSDVCANQAPTTTSPEPAPPVETSLVVQCEKSSDCQLPRLIDWCGKKSITGGPNMESVAMAPGCYQMTSPKTCGCEDPRFPSP
ncbi:hypothetical protein GLAREA_04165 [Glarea lozoyensis ATCC 20868]|uniref:Uncharacterized protein n=1 Tax=Glarea lozoyensis (strain ATCC 20868 / MF5171) TaxID=1116229 RepID=S3DXW9_GLAL2|nr:uncharacterized protein GLAREA_04165 [Glarea lozoyensis ATCC 20868]EPE31198.1 hypothetical protein GLAREA_04165 [Glarea lozoyensis ATCC 20868]